MGIPIAFLKILFHNLKVFSLSATGEAIITNMLKSSKLYVQYCSFGITFLYFRPVIDDDHFCQH